MELLDELNLQACNLSAGEEYESAILLFSKLIECYELYPEVYNNRGECYYYSKQYQLAIEDFNKALSISFDVHTYYYRGCSKREIKDFKVH